ncbi:heavy metal translocating P-type ATPase [Wansuia hejianensis]|uniref:Cadmium-translocating P-type ATPase n=1 Tax=Wansuia hejianensis TaxID=2763667 RepID=A0A926F404_9FIRM|nr:heavy metal translocating P-type ATPase [Wansuia hejianensis]MBC8591484.1 cadmium-translocating P-type ATPase [Wansuia hejianensis]
MASIELELEGLNCAGCASKIEKFSQDLDGVSSANLDFVTKKLKVQIKDEKDREEIVDSITKTINKLEPDVKVVDKLNLGKDHNIHGHSHDHGSIHKEDLIKIIISGLLFILPYIFKIEGTLRFGTYLLSYLIVGYEIIIIAIKNVLAGIPFDENFLMTIATIGAFIIGEYPEGVAVMLFYQVGELFQGMAVNHSRSSIESLMDIRPDYANLVKGNETVKVNPVEVNIDDYIVVKPGEKVPLDGIVVEGESTLDTSNITGESVPRSIKVGDQIISGVVNNQGLLKIKVNKEFKESTISKILDLVENASSRKAPTENFITKFARYYTPVVVYIALAMGVIPPLFFNGSLKEWAYRAFVFLVISCPCALVISIPLGFFGGIGAASKKGILIKGGNYLEGLNDVDTIVFDKTGTITKGIFKVTKVESYDNYSEEEILELAAYGESYSNHPIGRSIIEAYNKNINKERISNYKEVSGKGIQADIDGNTVFLGNKGLLLDNNIHVRERDSIGTIVYVGINKKHVGTIIVSDELKIGIQEDIKRLKSSGIKTIMLSGDNEDTAKKVAELAGIDKSYGDLLPQDKVSALEKILKENKDKKVVFVGDGVNDAPVLARADIGISMGALGSDAAIEASDIVIMTDEISKISTGMKIARNTKKIVTQNIVLALGVKLIVLTLGAFGVATMWEAVFADVGVSVLAIFNSIRALKVED